MTTVRPTPPATRARGIRLPVTLWDEIDQVAESIGMTTTELVRRRLSADLEACRLRESQLVREIDAASAELYVGICHETPPDIEVQPRIVRSA